MTKHWIVILSLLVLAPSLVTAQESNWSLTVNPRVGYFTSDKALGTAGRDGDVIKMSSAPTVGLSIELGTPLDFIGLRANAQTSIGAGLNQRVFSGFSSCGQNCFRAEHTSQPLDRPSSILNLSIDALLSPAPEVWWARPYGVVGVGLKRYDLGREPYVEKPGYHFGGRGAGLALNAGVGLDVTRGSTVVSIEAVDYMSGLRGRVVHDRSPLSELAFNGIRHDMVLSVGLKLKLLGR